MNYKLNHLLIAIHEKKKRERKTVVVFSILSERQTFKKAKKKKKLHNLIGQNRNEAKNCGASEAEM